MRIFKELLKIVTFDNVFAEIIKYWPEEERKIEGYKKVYNKLLSKRATKSDTTIKCEIVVDDFDNSEYIDVYGVKEGTNERWGLCFCSWSEWLAMQVDETVNCNINQIVAGILYELTFNGFTEQQVSYRRRKLNNCVVGAKECVKYSNSEYI